MKKYILSAFVAVLAGCAGIVKVEGDQLVSDRLVIKVTEAWNKVSLPGSSQPYEVWTQEGLSLDQLRFWAGIKSGQPLMVLPAGSTPSGQKAPRVPTFVATMQADELVSLFELLYSADGSVVTINKVEPATFANEKGVRYEFMVLRKGDNLTMNVKGWVSVRKGELFAASFSAPKLSFYGRLLPKAEAVVGTAQIKG
jgi:hypothetical protein